jgi:hypothetical protein
VQSCESSCDGGQGQVNMLLGRCLGSNEQARPVCAFGDEVKVSVTSVVWHCTAWAGTNALSILTEDYVQS